MQRNGRAKQLMGESVGFKYLKRHRPGTMEFEAYVVRHRVLLVEALLLSILSGGMLMSISIFQTTSDANPDAGALAALWAFVGLVLLGIVVVGLIGTLCLTYAYRRWRGIQSEYRGPLLVFGVSLLSVPLIGIRAVPIWVFGTTAYVYCMLVYRWWYPVSPSQTG